jgi:hypothetical protein
MAGIFFEYFEGYLRVDFSQLDWGDIAMRLSLHGDIVATTPCDDDFKKDEPEIYIGDDVQIEMRISAVFCAFGHLIRWLEAIVIGVEECAFTWEAEGPDGELRWRGSWDKGMLAAKWYSKESVEGKVRLNKAQMVGEFYRKFRSFVESEHYEPLRYERLTVAEIAELMLKNCSLAELAQSLTIHDRDEAQRIMDAVLDIAYFLSFGKEGRRSFSKQHPKRVSLAYCIEFSAERGETEANETDEGENLWFPYAWDAWDTERRRSHVLTVIFPSKYDFNYGAKLRQLRSSIVEEWLKKQDELARAKKEISQ